MGILDKLFGKSEVEVECDRISERVAKLEKESEQLIVDHRQECDAILAAMEAELEAVFNQDDSATQTHSNVETVEAPGRLCRTYRFVPANPVKAKLEQIEEIRRRKLGELEAASVRYEIESDRIKNEVLVCRAKLETLLN